MLWIVSWVLCSRWKCLWLAESCQFSRVHKWAHFYSSFIITIVINSLSLAWKWNVNMYIVAPLVNFFLDTFKLVGIINENIWRNCVCWCYHSLCRLCWLQGNGGWFLSHAYPQGVWLSKYNRVAYLHSLNLLYKILCRCARSAALALITQWVLYFTRSYARELSVASDSLCVAGLWLSLTELGSTLNTLFCF